MSVARRRLHIEDDILDRQQGSTKSATTHVVVKHVTGRTLLGTLIIGFQNLHMHVVLWTSTRKETTSRGQGFSSSESGLH